jgi:hypothetical protein
MGISVEMGVNQRRMRNTMRPFIEEGGYGKVIIGNWYFRE